MNSSCTTASSTTTTSLFLSVTKQKSCQVKLLIRRKLHCARVTAKEELVNAISGAAPFAMLCSRRRRRRRLGDAARETSDELTSLECRKRAVHG